MKRTTNRSDELRMAALADGRVAPAPQRAREANLRTSRLREAMTLVEVMVAMAIIAIVAVMCVSAFMTVIGSETRETNTRLASEEAEAQIAAGATTAAIIITDAAIEIGGFEIPAEVHTYTVTKGAADAIVTENGEIDVSGSRSYSVLVGKEPE
jgi:prepilin-type N-terminal cleavage/methylation domain-containing protein